MIRIDHRHGTEFPWVVCQPYTRHPDVYFRTHMEALKYCLQRLENT